MVTGPWSPALGPAMVLVTSSEPGLPPYAGRRRWSKRHPMGLAICCIAPLSRSAGCEPDPNGGGPGCVDWPPGQTGMYPCAMPETRAGVNSRTSVWLMAAGSKMLWRR
jgi:hypothetical protein